MKFILVRSDITNVMPITSAYIDNSVNNSTANDLFNGDNDGVDNSLFDSEQQMLNDEKDPFSIEIADDENPFVQKERERLLQLQKQQEEQLMLQQQLLQT